MTQRKKMSKKASKKSSKKSSIKSSKKASKRMIKMSKRKSMKKSKKPLSPECQKMLNIRKKFNIKAFEEGTVFKSGHKYHTKQQAISSAFNQLRKVKPDCFE